MNAPLPPDSDAVGRFLRELQDTLCEDLQRLDGRGRFRHDAWERPGGGGGESRILRDGDLFEQAGVGFSHVFGDALPTSASKARPELAGHGFAALGVSLVLHPHNPYVPTTHANFRFFTTVSSDAPPAWWFGGGFDLTPYYPFHEDVLHWHRTARNACEVLGGDSYARYKNNCDDYFYLPHRDETRGVGGLFFDDLNEPGFERSFAFTQSAANHFLPAYRPIVEARRDQPYGEREREFQLYRRGRYVEFNLIHDRGTLFGLQSGGRTESILMSLPPRVRWEYNWQPQAGSPEELLYRDYLKRRDWLADDDS